MKNGRLARLAGRGRPASIKKHEAAFDGRVRYNYTATERFLVMAVTPLRDCNPIGILADKQIGCYEP
jgi:hypothetical protein